MKYFLTVIILCVQTQFCVTALEQKDEDNLVTNHHSRQHSSNYLEDNLRPRNGYSKNENPVRFEDDPPKLLNEPHFFPIDADNPEHEETNGVDGNLNKYTFHNDEQLYDNDDEKRLDKRENYENRDTENTGTQANISGRLVFEDNIKTENREPAVKKQRKSRRKQRVYPLPNTNDPFPPTIPVNYPGNPYPSQQPGYSLYQPGYDGSFQGYGLFPGYQAIGPPHQLNNPVNPDPNSHTDQLNTKYHAQYPTGATGGQVSPVIPGYLQNAGYPGNGKYGFHAYPNSQYGFYTSSHNPGYPGYPGPQQHRPKSLTQQAVSAVAEALTSIALFDDKQCVPRILCEVASGSSGLSPTLLKATAGLGPLLSILQTYNSASSSPLFHFGRAAVLGMTSIGNPISCHRAYPQCPRDPTELVNYLNNHNGGFFRFFGQPQKQQNLEQFYNHLAGQTGQQQITQHNYANTYGYGNQNPYVNSNDPNNYQKKDNGKNSKDTEEIQDRIQNKPSVDIDDEEVTEDGSKWTFPDEDNDRRRRPRKQKFTVDGEAFSQRGSSLLKFPEERPTVDTARDKIRDYIRTHKVIFFPNQNDLNIETNSAVNKINLREYEFDYNHNFYVKRPEQNTNYINDETQVVYIVRGNGDPNHPEIVKIKPGQRA